MGGIKTTVYDWMGYFIPGAVIAWAISELIHLRLREATGLLAREFPVVVQVLLMLVVCYIAGHIIHAIANLTVDRLPSGGYPPRNYFPEKFRRHFPQWMREALLDAILRMTGVSAKRAPGYDEDIIRDAYWLCFVSVVHEQPASLIQLFHSVSGFYRGMSVSFFLVGVTYLVSGVAYGEIGVLILGIGAAVLAVAFLFRIVRFKDYLTKTVYMTFLAVGRSTNPKHRDGVGGTVEP